MDLITVIFPTLQLAVSGALGGVARWILLQPKSWTDRLGTVVLGAILGAEASPQIEPSLQSAMASGLFFGLLELGDDLLGVGHAVQIRADVLFVEMIDESRAMWRRMSLCSLTCLACNWCSCSSVAGSSSDAESRFIRPRNC